jgi:TldD protein
MTQRRDFLKHGAALAAMYALTPDRGIVDRLMRGGAPLPDGAMPAGPEAKALMADALNAAKMAGATYADVRLGRQRQNFVFTREAQIQNVVDTDSMGCGVRALVNGTWGFAATRTLTSDGVAAAAREAVAIARANAPAQGKAVQWLPSPSLGERSWKGAFTVDPWSITVEEKADLLLRANAAAMKVAGVKYVFSGFFFVKEERNYANTDGTIALQENVRSWPTMDITAISKDFSDFQSRGNIAGGPCEAVGRRSCGQADRQAGRCRTIRPRAASESFVAHDP